MLYGNLGLINPQHYEMADSHPDTIQAADTGGAEGIPCPKSYISLRQDKTEGRLLKQLHGSSLHFHKCLWKKHCIYLHFRPVSVEMQSRELGE